MAVTSSMLYMLNVADVVCQFAADVADLTGHEI